jgi:hypothetical protein
VLHLLAAQAVSRELAERQLELPAPDTMNGAQQPPKAQRPRDLWAIPPPPE